MAAEAAIHAIIGAHNTRWESALSRLLLPSRMLKLAWTAACAAVTNLGAELWPLCYGIWSFSWGRSP
jgi:hypothetical protein